MFLYNLSESSKKILFEDLFSQIIEAKIMERQKKVIFGDFEVNYMAE